MAPTNRSTPWTPLHHALLVAALLLPATNSPAGRVPEQWDDLPQIDSFSFSERSVGLGERFVLNRATGRMHEVMKEEFSRSFAGVIGTKTAMVKEDAGIGSTVVLTTSRGAELVTRDADCSEGGNEEHALWMDGAPVKDHVDPCNSVSAAETVGDQLWLGTRYDGEYGEYPANGVVVQTLGEGRLVKTLSTKEGLTGDLIRAIRLDPFAKTIWISSNEGINEVDREFRVRRKLFFHQELDPKTGAVTVGLSPTKLFFYLDVDPTTGFPIGRLSPSHRESDPVATFIQRLHASDPKRLYDLLVSIPAAPREEFFHNVSEAQYRIDAGHSLASAFAPEEMNVLVPFFIDAARSPDESERRAAQFYICAFNDQRVIDFLIEQRDLPASPPPPFNSGSVQRCLDKFAKFGLVRADQQKDHIASLLEQELEAFERIRAATFNDVYPDIKLVLSLASDLKQAGTPQGMDLINEYFRAMDGNRHPGTSDQVHAQMFRDAKLYDRIGISLATEDDISPGMVEGLTKVWFPMALRTGCRYFDMRHLNMPRRFDAKYAVAILVAIDKRPARPSPDIEDFCAEAFKSQLGNSDVREAFFNDVYPQLTPQQKELADRLSKEAPGPVSMY